MLNILTLTVYWDLERPLRIAYDNGHIGYTEYNRRRAEGDYQGLPKECYFVPNFR